MMRQTWWAELQANYSYGKWVQEISRRYFFPFLRKHLQGTEDNEYRDTFTGEPHVNKGAAVVWPLCWTHALGGAKRGQRAFTPDSSNTADHKQTWSKLALLSTSHLDTAGRTWPEQRRCGGCHQSWCPPLQTQQSLCTGARLSRPSHRCGTALPQPTLQTPEGARCHHPPRWGQHLPQHLQPQRSLCPWYIPTSRLISKEKGVNITMMGKLTLKHQQKSINYESSAKGKVSKAGRLGRSWCNRDEVLLLTYWSGSLAVAASETSYMG